jgi:hypothetical protein
VHTMNHTAEKVGDEEEGHPLLTCDSSRKKKQRRCGPLTQKVVRGDLTALQLTATIVRAGHGEMVASEQREALGTIYTYIQHKWPP